MFQIKVVKKIKIHMLFPAEMGRTCGIYGGEERCIQGFSGET
jgi:hypothetical protein